MLQPSPDSQFLARNTPGISQHDAEPQIDVPGMRLYRLGRVQEMLKERALAGECFSTIPSMFATPMAPATCRSGSCTISTDTAGSRPKEEPFSFDYPPAVHLSEHLETIREIRPARTWTYFGAGDTYRERVRLWADELVDVIRETSGGDLTVAADHLDPSGARALEERGCTIANGQEVMERARSIKSDDEIQAMLRLHLRVRGRDGEDA